MEDFDGAKLFYLDILTDGEHMQITDITGETVLLSHFQRIPM